MLSYLTIVPHELDAMSRIYPGGAEITRFNTHFLHVRVLAVVTACQKESKYGERFGVTIIINKYK